MSSYCTLLLVTKYRSMFFFTGEDKLDILVNNAGVMMAPYTKSKDGYELQMAVNHLGIIFTLRPN